MPEPLAPARWDWSQVRRVLVVRLRSIGDTVLATPALHALRRFVPHAQIERILHNLGLTVQRAEAGWRLTPPSFRFDLRIEADLIAA